MANLLSRNNAPLPATCKALLLEARDQPLKVTDLSVPQPGPGRVIVKVVSTIVVSFAAEVYTGQRPYPFPTPFVPGGSCIGTVVAVGDDSSSIEPGQTVFVHMFITARDDENSRFLFGLNEGYFPPTQRLMQGEWRNATWAEYVKAPLENCIVIKDQLTKGLGYTANDLAYMQTLLVPYGGLRDINLLPGETIIISPATGGFGGAAVQVALAMGAGRVIAMGRNEASLQKLAAMDPRIATVKMTGNIETELAALQKLGPVDAVFDISSPMAQKSTHLRSAICALRFGGRVSLMSGLVEDYALPLIMIMGNSIQIRGKFMYERSDIPGFMKLIECGHLKLGHAGGNECAGSFNLEEYEEALDMAGKTTFAGKYVVFNP